MLQDFRQDALQSLTNDVGVYALVDLDGDPLYVGKSHDGIRNRVRRHLTSARSDIIANRQIDPWEIAEVWAWPCAPNEIAPMEAALFRKFDAAKTLMNGSIPSSMVALEPPDPAQKVQVLPGDVRSQRLQPEIRLPRQIEHYNRLVDYILVVKDARHLRRSAGAHYERLSRYHDQFLKGVNAPVGSDEDCEQT